MQAERYIHLNPLEAGRVKDLGAYRWSSYRVYDGLDPPRDWLKQDVIYEMHGGKAAFGQYLSDDLDDATCKFYARKSLSPVLGEKTFRCRILADFKGNTVETSILKKPCRRPTVKKIEQAVCRAFDSAAERLLAGGRGRSNLPRRIAIFYTAAVSGRP